MSENTSVNPNTPVIEVSTDLSGKAVVDATGGPLTFDDLDQVLATKKSKKHEAKPEAKEKSDKSIDLSSDDKKGGGKAAEKDEKSDSTPKKESKDSKEQEKTDQSKEAKELRKLIKAKYADKEIELDEETLVPVQINGKEELWTLKDLRADKSGKVAWDKKFTELDKERKTVTTDKQKLDMSVKAIQDAFEEKDPHLKIYKIAKIAGADPVQFRTQWFNDQIKMLENYYAMSEDERKADAMSYEAKIHKHRADTLEKQSSEQQANQALLQKIDSIRASHQISEDEFYNRFDELNAQVKSGKMEPSRLTPEGVAETIVVDRYWNQAAEKLDSLSLGWSTEERNKALVNLVKRAMALELKPTDLPEVIDEVYGVKKAQKKIDEKKKENSEFIAGKQFQDAPKVSKQEATFFNEI